MQQFSFGDAENCWRYMLRVLLFDCLHRAYLTDLHPRILYRLDVEREWMDELRMRAMEEFADSLQSINADLDQAWRRYSRGESSAGELAIVELTRAAHFLATAWEVQHILAPVNVTDPELAAAVEEQALRLQELQMRMPAAARLQLGAYKRVLDAIGRLRFQKRWGREFRLPETTVLGHSLLVALVVLLLAEALRVLPKSERLTVLTALFHDLPEALVRDIPRPLRRKIEDVVRTVEAEEMNLLLRGLDWEVERELHLFSGTLTEEAGEAQEFDDVRVGEDGRVTRVKGGSRKEQDVRWGCLVKWADDFCAWLEAVWTIERGVRSATLERWMEEFPRRLEIWEGERWYWEVRQAVGAREEGPVPGDVLVFFYTPTGGADPGFYGWAVELEWLREERLIYFRPVSPSDRLKMRPWWDEKAAELADRIRGRVKQGTLWRVPTTWSPSSAKVLSGGPVEVTGAAARPPVVGGAGTEAGLAGDAGARLRRSRLTSYEGGCRSNVQPQSRDLGN